MEFALATKKPTEQNSIGKLTKSQILILAFLKSKAKQGVIGTTYSEIAKGLNISRTMTFNAIRDLLLTEYIIRLA